MVSALGKAVEFFREFGLFDVLLPFLLVFSIVFAILEKTRVLGEENNMPKRSLNAMVGFVVGMLVIATNKIVNIINTALPNITLLAIFIVMFLMLVGIFYGDGTFNFANQHSATTMGFMIALLIGVILIVLQAVKMDDGRSWLGYGWDYLMTNASGSVVGSIIFGIIAIAGVVWLVTSMPKPGASSPPSGGDDE